MFLQSPLVLKQDTFTLADLAKRAGLATAIFGKWHLGFGEKGASGNHLNITLTGKIH